MSRNDAQDFAQRLYARIPGNYRVYDQEQGLPLLALMQVVGEQAANLRQDLDALWDNFFIETCEDWVVPYIGALLGANLLAHPVGQSNRLDVWNTVVWRRSKGTPRMLAALASEISGWPIDLAEFFQSLGWSQNLNHLRLDHPLTPDVRRPSRLDLLGHAADPFAHAADFKPAHPLDQPRVSRSSVGIGRSAWGTPGRYQIRNLGFFARRLATFPVNGATPAAALPGAAPSPNAAFFTFDPLFRDVPLFVKDTGLPLTRAAFQAFGADIAVRQFGVPLAGDAQPAPSTTASRNPATFGGAAAGLQLDAASGMRLLNPDSFRAPGAHFTIAAEWRGAGAPVVLGSLSTLLAAFVPGAPAAAAGQLVITIRNGFSGLPPSPAGRFPGAVIAVRAARTAAVHRTDALYVYLPAGFVTPAAPLSFVIADDGSAYTRTDLGPQSLARASEGRVYPARPVAPSAAPAAFLTLNRKTPGIRLLDPSRFGNGASGILVRADIANPDFQALGAVASVNLTGAIVPGVPLPNPWPANTYISSTASLTGNLPAQGLLSLHVSPVNGTFLPESELVLTNRDGRALLVYLPEFPSIGAAGADLFVADDGSTYFAPADQVGRLNTIGASSFASLPLARAAAGQVLPIAGVYPIEQRLAVALDLCRPERGALLAPGQFGVDPELGRFTFAPGDTATGAGPSSLSVDYVEAFSDTIGALNSDRQLQTAPAATRLISRAGDASASAPVHTDIASAFAAAKDGDIIEIIDSATYAAAAPAAIANSAIHGITLRAAAGQRPCLAFYRAAGVPATASLLISSAMNSLDLNGLLISGGPLTINAPVLAVSLTACTLDPAAGSLVATDANRNSNGDYILTRSITGPVLLNVGVGRIAIADSIVDGRGAAAAIDAATVQLERVTVLGRIHCEVFNASESLLDDIAVAEDQQAGCIRFTRFELNSVLPRRYQCVPSEDQARASKTVRCLAPLFNSLRYGRPNYMQLAAGCPPEILSASADGAEVGAFAGSLNPIRLGNLSIKLREFMPAGLSAVVIGET